MRAAISKFVGLMIFISAACAFADTKLPKCVIYTFGHCQGSLKYPNGDIYTGEFNYGQPNGAGKMTYANGDLYAGNFFEGQKHGIGDYTWADGNRYIGQFIGGNLEGRGAYYFLGKNKTNPDKYVGDFKKNTFNGDGIYRYGNGAVVAGKFKDGKKVEDTVAVVVAESQKIQVDEIGRDQANQMLIKSEVSKKSNEDRALDVPNRQDLIVLAEVKRLQEENTKLKMQMEANKNSRSETEMTSGKSSDLITRNDDQATVNRAFSESGRFFVTGSLALLDINAVLPLDSIYGINLNPKTTPQEVPFSISSGYQFNDQLGIEFGYKNYRNQTLDIGLPGVLHYKASTWLLGAYTSVPIVPWFGMTFRGGIQSTSGTLTSITYDALTFNNSTIDAGSIPVSGELQGKETGFYFGFGLSVPIDQKNKLTLDYTRLRWAIPGVITNQLNWDVAELGLKHVF